MHDLLPVLKVLLAFVPLALVPLMIFMERKGASLIQDRVGPNRSALHLPGGLRLRAFGFVHNFSDAIKLFLKEDFTPARAHTWYYILAPCIPVVTAILTPALIPFFAPVVWEGGVLTGTALDTDLGLLLLFAFSSLSVYGIVLGSWASNSKYTLLGGLRASAMMISYEVAMGLSILGLLLIIGSFNLTDIVEWQATHAWGIVVQPVAFFMFFTCLFAETGRNPFDVQEGESEIVGGFHVEYSSMRFALFFMGEYAHVVVASLLMSTLFLGGYHLPFLDTGTIHANAGVVLGLVAVVTCLICACAAAMIGRAARRYARYAEASDQQLRQREYTFLRAVAGALAVLCGLGALLAWSLVPNPGHLAVPPLWAAVLTAVIQVGIVLAKTILFCWIFVWVRWTLPRFRYDQIMGLGWKVLLNVALVNLLLT
ncbi:MAG: complex I subunit 1/NuoH family protein, partial [Planctomycetota bacterium]